MQILNEEKQTETTFYWHTLLCALLIGIFAGVLVSFYRLSINYLVHIVDFLYQKALTEYIWFILLVVFLALSAFCVAYLVKKDPLIAGSGIPQIQYLLNRQKEVENWYSFLGAKFIGGCLCLAAGLSLGREGPCVQMGALLGSVLNRFVNRIRWDITPKVLMCCGAGAGLAAAFNAPLAGVLFVLEELRKKISPIFLVSIMIACLAADTVVQVVFGMEPVLVLPEFYIKNFGDYFSFLLLGVAVGIVGVSFNRLLLFFLQKFAYINVYIRMLLVFLLALLVMLFCRDIMGGREALIVELAKGTMALKLILLLLVFKLFYTVISYGTGVPGGIFFPLLAIGALVGAVIVKVLCFAGVLVDTEIFVVLAMAGSFAAIVKAPVTGMVLIAEMTGSFTCFLPAAVVCIVAVLISDALGGRPVYEMLLERLEECK